jgi:hypothetical protein
VSSTGRGATERATCIAEDELLALEAQVRRRLIDLFRRTGAERFLEAAMRLRKADEGMDRADWHRWLTEPRPRGAGRPEDRDGDELRFRCVERWPVRG